jgi:peptidyl-prolyl cis-trans isomerase C
VNRFHVTRIASVIVFAASLVACQDKTSTDSKSGAVLAEVNGAKITVSDLNEQIKQLPPQYQARAASPNGPREVLDSMVIQELFLEQAHKDDIDKSKAVEEKVALLQKQLDEMKKRLIIEEYLKQRAVVDEAQMKQFYQQNISQMKTGPQLHASHILVKTEEQAQSILAQLKNGADFAALAKQNSVDTASGANGGDLGWFSRETMVPQFANAAFALKVGQISGVVRTNYGFHIIKVTDKRAAGVRPYEEVREQIRTFLLPQAVEKLGNDLKKNAKVTIKEDELKKYGGAGLPPGHPAP